MIFHSSVMINVTEELSEDHEDYSPSFKGQDETEEEGVEETKIHVGVLIIIRTILFQNIDIFYFLS